MSERTRMLKEALEKLDDLGYIADAASAAFDYLGIAVSPSGIYAEIEGPCDRGAKEVAAMLKLTPDETNRLTVACIDRAKEIFLDDFKRFITKGLPR